MSPVLTCFATRRRAHGARMLAASITAAQVRRVTELALKRGPSIDFAGYYQRHLEQVA